MTYELNNEEGDRGDRREPHQLRPLKGGRYKTVLHGPPGTEIGDLHCDLEPYVEGEQPAMISHSGWMPDEVQAEMLAAGAHVRLSVWQHPIPPLAVSVEGPVCECHGEEMSFLKPEGETLFFACRHKVGEVMEDPSSPDIARLRREASGATAYDQLRRDFTPGEPEPEQDGFGA
jgi:hypothetical protein